MGRNAASVLKKRLDALCRAYDRRYLESDPLLFVHRYKAAKDREIVGLIASSLAYGRVDGIKRSVEAVLREMEEIGKSPYEFVTRFDPRKDKNAFKGFVHRFNRAEDIRCLVYFMRQMIEESGSIGEFFMKGYLSGAPDIKEALTAFVTNALDLDYAGIYKNKKGKGLPKDAGVRFFFPSPAHGSPCKRLNLYLRWMVRPDDGLDFGIWKKADPAKLIIPLDTHIGRICRNIGLTKRAIQDWKTAVEITARLRELDAKDPVRYDFAICRLGIMDACPRRKDAAKCAACKVGELCVL